MRVDNSLSAEQKFRLTIICSCITSGTIVLCVAILATAGAWR